MKGLLSIFGPANRTRLLIVAGLLVAGIAVTDWLTKPYISLGFLYLFPIIIVGGFLSRTQTIGVALVCAVLQESFSNLPENEAIFRLLLSSVCLGSAGNGEAAFPVSVDSAPSGRGFSRHWGSIVR